MKIAIVSTMTAVPWGGSEELWARTAHAALDEGHEVLVSVQGWPVRPPGVEALERRGARVSRRPRPFPLPGPEAILTRLLRRPVRFPNARRTLGLSPYGDVVRFRPDVVLVSEGNVLDAPFKADDLVAWLLRSGTPYAVVCQSNHDAPVAPHLRESGRRFYAGASRVAFVSRRNWVDAERQLAAALPNGCVVRNPVNLPGVAAVPWPAEEEPVLRLASVARLDVDSKGQDVLFQVLGSPAWRERPWQLALYGEGRDGAYLRELAELWGIAGRVRFAGQVSDIAAVWAENHLLVMPSRLEGTPLSLVEAMLCGRPAVVSDVGGNAEWIEEGRTGFVADAPSVRSFGAALERAWGARNGLRSLGERAREVALRQYDPAPGATLLGLLPRVARERANEPAAPRPEERSGRIQTGRS